MDESELRAALRDLCQRTPAGIARWPVAKVQRYKTALKAAMTLLSRYHATSSTIQYSINDLTQFHSEEQK